MTPHRQGDVLLLPVQSIPASAIARPKAPSVILALGEVTGHHHSLTGDLEVLDLAGATYLKIMGDNAQLTHQEHDVQVIEPGFYRLVNQCAWDSEYGVRPVRD